jgi:hypothetical protein
MKKTLLTLLVVILGLGLLGTIGYAGYRMGYAQGIEQQAGGDAPGGRPFIFERMRPGSMHMYSFEIGPGFHHGFRMGGVYPMGFGFFTLMGFLWRVAVIALIIGFVYWLFTLGGWRLTRVDPKTTTQE